jgi:hypothetical protein
MGLLEREPEARTVATKLADAKGHRRRDRRAFAKDLVEGGPRYAEESSDLGLGPAERREHILA